MKASDEEYEQIVRAHWKPLTLQLSSEERQDLHAALVTVLEDEDLWWGEDQRVHLRRILERVDA